MSEVALQGRNTHIPVRKLGLASMSKLRFIATSPRPPVLFHCGFGFGNVTGNSTIDASPCCLTRDTYPKSYITKYTSIRRTSNPKRQGSSRLDAWEEHPGRL